jgi:hypothetical protein
METNTPAHENKQSAKTTLDNPSTPRAAVEEQHVQMGSLELGGHPRQVVDKKAYVAFPVPFMTRPNVVAVFSEMDVQSRKKNTRIYMEVKVSGA